MIKLTLVLGIVIAMISSGHLAHAENQKLVCVYQPMDLFMDKSLPDLISSQVQTHGVNVKTVRIIDQILGKDSDCNVVIKIDRAINENYRYTDKTTKYQIVNNTITIFTYKTSASFSLSDGGGNTGGEFAKGSGGSNFKPMTNWNCELIAQSSHYRNNYHIGDSDYHSTYTGYCNPYAGHSDPLRTGELPYNVIRNSVDSSLAKLGFQL